LTVPVNSSIAALLARYPLPNDPHGAVRRAHVCHIFQSCHQYGSGFAPARSSLFDKATLFLRFSRNQVTGPITNPDQTVIDPDFGVKFFDHQRNAAVKYSRTLTPHFSYQTTLGYIRSTPLFITSNHTQPALAFGDGLFEGFNSADGSIFVPTGTSTSFNTTWSTRTARIPSNGARNCEFNRDSTIFERTPTWLYTFGGGTAYSPVLIPSASGQHDIHPGDPLPDSLTVSSPRHPIPTP